MVAKTSKFQIMGVNVFPAALYLVLMLVAAYLGFYYSGLSLALLIIFGFLLAIIDTSLGMGFGTIGTPILLIAGFSSKVIVPAVLIAQFLEAGAGSFLHRKYKNADVLNLKSKDGKIMLSLVAFGIIGAIIAVVLAIKVQSLYVNTYIGLLIIAMGFLLLIGPKIRFSWPKLFVLSVVTGFNKVLSGAGYGPVSTTGLMAAGNKIRNAVGITVFTVAIINIVGFLLYLLSGSITNYLIILGLSAGAIFGSQIGPRITRRFELKRDERLLGVIALILGLLTLLTALGYLNGILETIIHTVTAL